jgi:hypothetical protein
MSVLQLTTPETISETVYVGTTDNNIRYELAPGITDFYGDTVLIWRLRYDSATCSPENVGIWTTFDFRQTAVSGASTTDPIEVASWTTSDKTLYVNVNDVRRMDIDVTNTTISCAALRVSDTATMVESYSSAPVVDSTWHTELQVWDIAAWDFRTGGSIDTSGILYTEDNFSWHQRATTGAFL